MEITSLISGYVSDRAKAGETVAGNKRNSNNSASKRDRVSVSDEAKRRAAADSSTVEEPIRREKVEEIKALIANGEYEINTGKIAKRIVQEDPGFFLSKKNTP